MNLSYHFVKFSLLKSDAGLIDKNSLFRYSYKISELCTPPSPQRVFMLLPLNNRPSYLLSNLHPHRLMHLPDKPATVRIVQ